jgi:hypothetical protein
MVDRLAAPGPSYLKEQEARVGERPLRIGLSRPTTGPDDWWMTILWAEEDGTIVPFTDLAPGAGPPPDPPLARLGPAFAGALSGLILEDDGRLQLRLGLVVAPEDAERPWRSPALVRFAARFEPARATVLRPNELATEVLTAFRRSVEALGRP